MITTRMTKTGWRGTLRNTRRITALIAALQQDERAHTEDQSPHHSKHLPTSEASVGKFGRFHSLSILNQDCCLKTRHPIGTIVRFCCPWWTGTDRGLINEWFAAHSCYNINSTVRKRRVSGVQEKRIQNIEK
jgi:hypothetical protein